MYFPATHIAGATQVMEVVLTWMTVLQGMSPTLTDKPAPLTNDVPVMVRMSPPATCLGWMTGVTAVTTGGAPAIVTYTTKIQSQV